MDGTGIPVVKKETQGRKGKTDGQPAHTREAKLGCVFTQTSWDAEGYPIRDPDSTTYTGAIETAEEFGKRLYLEAWNRGWSRAQKKVVLGDGAEWIWNLAAEHFPSAIQIVDLYHVRRHLWDVARKLRSDGELKLAAARSPLTQRTTQPGAAELAGQASAPAPRRALCAKACATPPWARPRRGRQRLPPLSGTQRRRSAW
jgi:hypothetical protein